MKRLILILSSLLFSCIGGGISDFIEDLGGGYFYLGEGTGFNEIFKGEKKTGFPDYIHVIDSIIIHPEVDIYTYNKEFILLRQKPSLEARKRYLGDKVQSIAESFKLVDSLSIDNAHKVDVKTYKRYINDSAFYRMIASKISLNNTIKDQEFCNRLADSIIKRNPQDYMEYSNSVNYWIIDKERDKLFGPYSKEEYLREKAELGVPKKLKLKE